jgi:5-methylcytosine-specific restriction endonuclease McrA
MCQGCGERPSVIVHHIVELKAGGDPFRVDNCQAVCQSCHNVIHKGGVGAISRDVKERYPTGA